MCSPQALGIGTGLVQGASAVLGHIEQNRMAEANKESALQSLRIQTNDLNTRGVQEGRAAAVQTLLTRDQAAMAGGQLRAGAAAAGVTGNSAAMLEHEVVADEAAQLRAIKEQKVVTLDQIERMKTGARAEAQGRIASVPKANPWATGLRIGGAVLSGFGTYNSLK